MAERQPKSLTKEQILERIKQAGVKSQAWMLFDPLVLTGVLTGNYRKTEWRVERLEQKEMELIRPLPRRPLVDIGK